MKSWDDRYAEFLERVMANAVAGGDPKPLQEELKKLLAEKPPEKKDAEGQSVSTASCR
jgi:hypothetical protein